MPASYRVLQGGAAIPALETLVPAAMKARADGRRSLVADGARERAPPQERAAPGGAQNLTFWRRPAEEIAFGQRGVVGSYWGVLEAQSKYKVSYKVQSIIK